VATGTHDHRTPVDPSGPGVPSGPRDRRDDGRPEQARPRDRTGRPLPYGTQGVELAEPCEVSDLAQALTLGAARWDAQRYFEAHELLELAWKEGPAHGRELWKGVIQVAVAGVHLQRGNAEGARRLLERALGRLERQPPATHGIDVEALRALARDRCDALRDGRVPDSDLGPLPTLPGGARLEPAATS
jgi:predicted metal-dependent hydrolase